MNVVCDIIGSKYYVGVQLTKGFLHKGLRPFNHPAAIKPPLAGIRDEERNLRETYFKFLDSASRILKQDGRIMTINLKANAFRSAVLKTGGD
ncbi:MAG: hypothetical protein ACUVQ0_06475 [Thermoproteota archaeon]